MSINSRLLEHDRRKIYAKLHGFSLSQCDCCRSDAWQSLTWVGRAPTGHLVKARYPTDYPYSQLNIKVVPDVQTSHKINGGCLCLMHPSEWQPQYGAVGNILIAFRFLAENRQGRTG